MSAAEQADDQRASGAESCPGQVATERCPVSPRPPGTNRQGTIHRVDVGNSSQYKAVKFVLHHVVKTRIAMDIPRRGRLLEVCEGPRGSG